MGGVREKQKEKRNEGVEAEVGGGGKKEGLSAGPDAGSFRARPAQLGVAVAVVSCLVWSEDAAALPMRPASRSRRSSGNARLRTDPRFWGLQMLESRDPNSVCTSNLSSPGTPES